MSDKQQNSMQSPTDAAARREQAEEQVRTMEPSSLGAQTPEEIQRVIYELRVCRIELEMQNKDLRTAQAKIEAERARYIDLYDLAPVGYCTFSEKGLILEANLTAATLLGETRNALVNQPISRFILKEDQDIYSQHRKQLFETGEPQKCELRLVKPDDSLLWAHLSATAAQAEDGAPLCRVVISDITERKRTEEALKKRIVALTQPLDTLERISFEELFNNDELQRLQDEFSRATGVASIITHPNGVPITEPSNFCRLCIDIIRKTEIGSANCFKSDAVLGRPNSSGPTVQPCLSGGLLDAGAAIYAGDRHIANWLIGQVRDEEQAEDKIRTYARAIGADEEAAAKAFWEVPAMSRRQFEQVASVLFTLANQISKSAWQNVQHSRFLTERKRAEEVLNQSVEERCILLNNIQTQIWYLSDDHTYGAVNKAHADFNGVKIEDLAFRDMYDLFPRDIVETCRQSNIKVFTTGRPVCTEEWVPHVSGERRLISILKTPKLRADGTVKFVVCSAEDITERKRAEEALKESEFRARAMLQAIPDMMFRLNRHGVFLSYKADFSDLYAQDVPTIIGKHTRDILPPEFVVLIDEKIRIALETGSLQTFEYQLPIPGRGVRDYECRMIRSAADEVTTIVRDITERKRHEQQLSTALSEQEVLLREVHHRVKNNLAGIISIIDMQRRNLEDPKGQIILTELSNRIRSMSLVHEKLYRADSLSSIDFHDYIQALISDLHTTFGSPDITCRVDAPGVIIPLDLASPCGLIVNELVTNALKYAFPEGKPRPGNTDCRVLVRLQRDKDTYTLTVADNGIGWPAGFDWTETKTLGLTLVRMLGQHQLGGRYVLDQENGTSITLTFTNRKKEVPVPG